MVCIKLSVIQMNFKGNLRITNMKITVFYTFEIKLESTYSYFNYLYERTCTFLCLSGNTLLKKILKNDFRFQLSEAIFFTNFGNFSLILWVSTRSDIFKKWP